MRFSLTARIIIYINIIYYMVFGNGFLFKDLGKGKRNEKNNETEKSPERQKYKRRRKPERLSAKLAEESPSRLIRAQRRIKRDLVRRLSAQRK